MNDADTAAQRDAIARLDVLKGAAVKVVAQVSGGARPEDQVSIQTFTMVPAARAVWLHAADVFYAWAGAIALDLIPTIFIILLTLGRPTEEEERDEERRRAAQRPAAAAPRPVAARGGTWPGGTGEPAAAPPSSRA